MAIYHFSGTVISRSGGKSAVASAAYRSGEKLYDERQEKVMNYSKKQDVLYKEIMLPKGAPEWMKDREKLWNEVEKAENRKDSQLAREVHFSLPRELSEEQNIELAKEFVKNEFVSRGMVADLCIHGGKGKDGEEQPHAHVMLTLREVTDEGFGLKERSWNAKENYMLWRESWAEHANRYLAMNGIEQRIDHRSNKDRGIDLEPQKKIGPENLRDHERRILEHNRIARNNGEKLLEDPTIALKAITYHQSTFTHHDLARFINRHTVDEEQFKVVYERVKNSEEIIFLGKDELGRERFSSREMVELEKGMMKNVSVLEERGFWGLEKADKQEVEAGVERDFTGIGSGGVAEKTLVLSEQQQEALEHIVGEGSVKCLVGYAGTGKSCLLDRARDIWEQNGYLVHGVTLAGIAAENLEYSSGIESRTFASRKYYWDKGEEKLSKKDVLVVDEAGMLGSRQLARIMEEVKEGGAKVVLLGDPQQLQAIEAGAAFRAIIEKTGYLELTEVRRQIEGWQQEATKEFALRNVDKALSFYEERGYIHYLGTQQEAKKGLVSRWNKERFEEPEKSRIMLAHTRKDVAELNEIARDCKKDKGELGKSSGLEVSGGVKEFAVGDRIYFLQNNRDMGVKNGTLGTIDKIDGLSITVRVDGNKAVREEQRQLTFSLDRYNHITHGYAATIHKAQGVTVDQSYILASKYMDSHLAYVGMTRHREKAELFLSKEEFANKEELEQVLGRDRSKDVTVDYIGQDLRKEYGLEENVELEKESRAKELIEEIGKLDSLSKEGDKIESRDYLQELKQLTQGDKSIAEGQRYLQEIRGYSEEGKNLQEHRTYMDDLKGYEDQIKQKESYDRFLREAGAKQREQEKGALEQGRTYPKNHELEREEITLRTLSPEERRAEKLVEEYYKFEHRHNMLEERGGSRFSITEAEGQMERCAHEICNNKYAMDYLKNNDRELFKEMEQTKELEKTLQLQRDVELSL